mmetsp:Transcript_11418/g.26490  ORF Transcript_11418/g.26490 Transcript_11418/m.26490 type:complete len:80 (-) Transcript_11418:534-773(-)
MFSIGTPTRLGRQKHGAQQTLRHAQQIHHIRLIRHDHPLPYGTKVMVPMLISNRYRLVNRLSMANKGLKMKGYWMLATA